MGDARRLDANAWRSLVTCRRLSRTVKTFEWWDEPPRNVAVINGVCGGQSANWPVGVPELKKMVMAAEQDSSVRLVVSAEGDDSDDELGDDERTELQKANAKISHESDTEHGESDNDDASDNDESAAGPATQPPPSEPASRPSEAPRSDKKARRATKGDAAAPPKRPASRGAEASAQPQGKRARGSASSQPPQRGGKGKGKGAAKKPPTRGKK